MTNKELLAQLNSLQATKPNQAWLSSNRDLLASQLYSGAPAEPALSWAIKFNIISQRIFQPQYVAIMIVLFFASSGLISFHASQSTKPGDSLYVAKRISERAQFMLAFSDAEKTRLNVEFATKRVQEMQDMIADQGMSIAEDHPEQIANLKSEAKTQIQTAKARIAKNNPISAPAPKVNKPAVEPSKPSKLNNNPEFIAAEATKDNARVDISLPDIPDLVVATRTIETVIDEADQMIDQNDLQGATKKLDEINQLIK